MKPCTVLVADPAWMFEDTLPGPKRGAAKHYNVQDLSDILRFPLPDLARDAWLFLWRVGSMQAEALQVVRAWGFRPPVSEFVWVKTRNDGTGLRIGMGRTVRNAHEVCLICKRGKPERFAADVPSVLFAPRGEHSAKPDAFYAAVERLTGPRAVRVELFARRERQGWHTFGDELERPHPGAGGLS